MKLLIVDDMNSYLDLEKTFLNRAYCELLTASTGLEAIKVAQNSKPDLIVLDVEMPEMNGIEATRILSSTPGLKDIPIVMLSSTERDKESIGAGAKAFYKKPVSQDEFLRMVRRFVPLKVREDPRKPLGVQCGFTCDGNEGRGELADLSVSGALLLSTVDLSIGDKLQLSFKLPGDEAVEVVAHVVRTAPPRGYGLGFLAVSGENNESIRKFVAG